MIVFQDPTHEPGVAGNVGTANDYSVSSDDLNIFFKLIRVLGDAL